ncbi:hypothetical protein OTK49_02445 [Vibrio coralliirubri]|uniref:hypothetical protein n=1 Tax=Vibrio coralliirubri TaxID=1516159 RepID=UPI00228390EE|nr:hypothetical protein [Vibrio coralliirubri]MCY9861376.1 hypothetical protein [Vibrio coralliirubri]
MKNKTFNLTHILLTLVGGICIGGSSNYVNNLTEYTGAIRQPLSKDLPTPQYVANNPCSLTTSALHAHAVAFESKVPDAAITLSDNSTFETYTVENVYTKPLKELCNDGFYIEYRANADTELTCHTNHLSSVGTVAITLPKQKTASDKLEHRVFVAGYGFSQSEGNADFTSVPNAFDDDPVVLVGVEIPHNMPLNFQDTIAETDLANLINLDTITLSEKLKEELDADSLEKIYRSRASTWM